MFSTYLFFIVIIIIHILKVVNSTNAQSEGNTTMSWKLLILNNLCEILVNNHNNAVYLPTPDEYIKVLECPIIFKGTCSHRVGCCCE